jgi:hypothetical protein
VPPVRALPPERGVAESVMFLRLAAILLGAWLLKVGARLVFFGAKEKLGGDFDIEISRVIDRACLQFEEG